MNPPSETLATTTSAPAGPPAPSAPSPLWSYPAVGSGPGGGPACSTTGPESRTYPVPLTASLGSWPVRSVSSPGPSIGTAGGGVGRVARAPPGVARGAAGIVRLFRGAPVPGRPGVVARAVVG